MEQDQLADIGLGEVAEKLELDSNFKAFIDEVTHRRNLIVQQSLLGRAEDYETYRELRGAFLAFNEVVGLTEELQSNAATVREQADESAE
jgi:hypothetical protein